MRRHAAQPHESSHHSAHRYTASHALLTTFSCAATVDSSVGPIEGLILVLVAEGAGSAGQWFLHEAWDIEGVLRQEFVRPKHPGGSTSSGGTTVPLRVGELARLTSHEDSDSVFLIGRCIPEIDKVTVHLQGGRTRTPPLTDVSQVSGDRFFVLELPGLEPSISVEVRAAGQTALLLSPPRLPRDDDRTHM